MRTPCDGSSSSCGRPSSSTRTGRTGAGLADDRRRRTQRRNCRRQGGRAARAPLDRCRLRRPQGLAVRRARSPVAVTEYGRAKAEAERRVAAACPGALLVRVADPGRARARAVEARARGCRRRRRSTRTRSAARCRWETSPRLSSSSPRSTSPGRCTSQARMPSRAPTSPSSWPAGLCAAAPRLPGVRSTARWTALAPPRCSASVCAVCTGSAAEAVCRSRPAIAPATS